jgi:hypothetical protein
MTTWYILCSFGTFSGFGIMFQEKSGNPGANTGSFVFLVYFSPLFR